MKVHFNFNQSTKYFKTNELFDLCLKEWENKVSDVSFERVQEGFILRAKDKTLDLKVRLVSAKHLCQEVDLYFFGMEYKYAFTAKLKDAEGKKFMLTMTAKREGYERKATIRSLNYVPFA